MQSIESKSVPSTCSSQSFVPTRAAVATLALLLIALGVPSATLGQGSSTAVGKSISLSLKPPLLPAVNISSPAAPVASGNAPPAYSDTDSLASVAVSPVLLGNILSTGVIDVAASSNVPNGPTTTASATVDGLGLNVVGLLSILSISADTVQSTATVGGTCGSALTRSGTTAFENATVGGSQGNGLTIAAGPAPNTVLLDILGIRVVLNEQTLTGNGTTTAGITVRAIHVTLASLSLGGIGGLTGDIIIGESTASVNCAAVYTPTATGTATSTATATRTPTATNSATRTSTATATATRTATPPNTATRTLTPSITATPTCGNPPTSSGSGAFGEYVQLSLLPLVGGGVGIESGPLPTAGGTAPAPYNDTHTAASATVASQLIGTLLQTGLLTAHADGVASGANASAEVDGLNLDINALLNVLGLTADAVMSTATAGGCGGALTATGTTTIVNGDADGPLGVGLNILANPLPNTVLLDIAGLRIVLNEQIPFGNGTTTVGLTVNAIHIELDNYLLSGLGVLSGEIIIAQSRVNAQIGAQPTATATRTNTATPTRTATASFTATRTATATVPPPSTTTSTPTRTLTPSITPTATCANPPTSSGSGAFGEYVHLSLLPLLGGGIGVDSGPLPNAGGTAPAPYNDTQTTLSATVAAQLIGTLLQTGVLTAHADGVASRANASAEVDNLNLDINALLNVLGLTADAVMSTATAGGCGGALTATGTTTIVNGDADGPLGVGLNILANPLPNTVLLDIAGLRIVLNEQIPFGNGTSTVGLTVNAIHIELDNYLLSGLGVVSGEIIIAQSRVNAQFGAQPTATATRTNTATPTRTATASFTATRTATATVPPASTTTSTPTRTLTPSITPTATCANPPTSSGSGAFGEYIHLSLLPLLGGGIGVDSGPLPSAGGTAPAPYNDTQTTLSATVAAQLIGTLLQTGVLTAHADGVASRANASAEVDNLNLDINALLNVLGLTADAVMSTATAGGCGGALTATGTTTIVNGDADGPLGVNLNILANPAPNTVLLDVAGLRITLNEQIPFGNGTTTVGLTVNAIHIELDNFLLSGLGVLSGEIIIAQSRVNAQFGPQPTSTATRTNTATPTRTATSTGTATPVPPTATLTRTATATAVPATATATRTNTAVPATATATNVPATATATSVPATATATRTNTAVPATATATATRTGTSTATATAIPPTATATRTNTSVPATATASATRTGTSTATPTSVPATATATAVPPSATATRTNTSAPATATASATRTSVATATSTSVPATATATSVPPTATATRTNTSAPATATATSPPSTATATAVPPTATATRTNTSAPATATASATRTGTSTVTATAVPPTPTATAAPPTATATRTNTSVPATATASATRTVPPTATGTAVPPTASATRTATGTAVPPTNTAIPATASATATRTGTPTASATAIPPSATATRTATAPPATATATSVPPSATATRTNTAAPGTSTATPTRTNTSAPATPQSTATRTGTPTASATAPAATATQTRTSTTVPATATSSPTRTGTAAATATAPPATSTATSVPSTNTPTRTSVPTASATAVPPSATATRTSPPTGSATAVSTATATAVQPTGTATATNPPATATSTRTMTAPASNATPTMTATSVPNTPTSIPATATSTAVSTATATATAVPPTATRTGTATAVPPTATPSLTHTPLPTSTVTLPPTSTPTPSQTPLPTATATDTPCVPPVAHSVAFGGDVQIAIEPLTGVAGQLLFNEEPRLQGDGPDAYSQSGGIAALNASDPLVGKLLASGTVRVVVSGDDAEHGTATSSSDVEAVRVAVTEVAALLNLTADRVTANAAVEGTCCTELTASGEVDIANGSLSCLLPAAVALPEAPAPNTVLLDHLGMRVVLNEQIVTGDGTEKKAIVVNAVHIYLDDVLVSGLGALRGEVIVGHAEASLTCDSACSWQAVGSCVGDCGGDHTVTVDEAITCINIGLGTTAMERCESIDVSHDHEASIEEIIQAVWNLLNGCPRACVDD